MADPQDMIVPMLQEMRAEMAQFRQETLKRLDALDAGQRNLRTALAGELVVNRMTIGDFDERIAMPERRVEELQGQK